MTAYVVGECLYELIEGDAHLQHQPHRPHCDVTEYCALYDWDEGRDFIISPGIHSFGDDNYEEMCRWLKNNECIKGYAIYRRLL